MSDPAILARIDALTDAVLLSMRMQGGRLTREFSVNGFQDLCGIIAGLHVKLFTKRCLTH